jgi:hypothetical protein
VIICDSRRFVFVHVQKTGGSTITKMIVSQLPDEEYRSNAKRHSPLAKILAKEPELTDYYVFGFVRDPWDRMVSWWNMIDAWKNRYRKRGISFEEKQNSFFRRCAAYETFDEFVLRGTAEIPRVRRPQVRYLRTRGRRADFIGRAENFAEDARAALDRVGLDSSSLLHHNRGHQDPRTYRDYYTDATRRRVEELFAPDIREFGYRF